MHSLSASRIALVRSVVLLLLCCMMPHGRHVNSLATPYHMPIFDALALVRSPHLRGLASAHTPLRGDFHDLWPRTVARKLTTMGFLRHWGDVVFVNTITSQPSPTNCEAEHSTHPPLLY